MSPPADQEAGAIRQCIEHFLAERLATKLDKLSPDDPKYAQIREQFEPERWIEDAARRVAQLQLVTHSLKPIHPDAKGTNLYVSPESLPGATLIGSHCLPADFLADVTGNAAALDVYKFLRLEVEGRSLLDRALHQDPHLAAALSHDIALGNSWMAAFAAITQPRGHQASHTRAKQLYWLQGDDPTDDTHYHLLAPLYPTALVHRLFQAINHDRFSEEAKAARKARREEQYSPCGQRDYPELAVQKLGGTKPQNISQLNSERGGQNYLLASLPPSWQSREVSAPLRTESVFYRFGRRRLVRHLTRRLTRFLVTDPANNVATRNYIDDILAELLDELILFSWQIHRLPPGWSADIDCRLPPEERYWLDPGRAAIDPDFRQQRQQGSWPAEIRQRFANWLNHALGQQLKLADAEHRHWARKLAQDASHQRWLDQDRRFIERLEPELDALEEELKASQDQPQQRSTD